MESCTESLATGSGSESAQDSRDRAHTGATNPRTVHDIDTGHMRQRFVVPLVAEHLARKTATDPEAERQRDASRYLLLTLPFSATDFRSPNASGIYLNGSFRLPLALPKHSVL